MSNLISAAILAILLGGYSAAFAAVGPPAISYNVTVAEKAAPGQCNGSWEGQTSPDVVNTLSGLGEESENTSPVVRSCTGCAVASAGSCVCKTCYDYFD